MAGYETILLAGPLGPAAVTGLRTISRIRVDEFKLIKVGNALGTWNLYVGRPTDTQTGCTVRVHHQVDPDATIQAHDLILDGTRTGRLIHNPTENEAIAAFRGAYWLG